MKHQMNSMQLYRAWAWIFCCAFAGVVLCFGTIALIAEALSPTGLSGVRVLEMLPDILIQGLAGGVFFVFVFTVQVHMLARYAPAPMLNDPTRPRCEHCRYDLRGVRADLCPECGTPRPQPCDLGAQTPHRIIRSSSV